MRIHPGETVAEVMRDRGLSVLDVASLGGLSPNEVVRLIFCDRKITRDIVAGLEHATGVPRDFWMNLQRQYDEEEVKGTTGG